MDRVITPSWQSNRWSLPSKMGPIDGWIMIHPSIGPMQRPIRELVLDTIRVIQGWPLEKLKVFNRESLDRALQEFPPIIDYKIRSDAEQVEIPVMVFDLRVHAHLQLLQAIQAGNTGLAQLPVLEPIIVGPTNAPFEFDRKMTRTIQIPEIKPSIIPTLVPPPGSPLPDSITLDRGQLVLLQTLQAVAGNLLMLNQDMQTIINKLSTDNEHIFKLLEEAATKRKEFATFHDQTLANIRIQHEAALKALEDKVVQLVEQNEAQLQKEKERQDRRDKYKKRKRLPPRDPLTMADIQTVFDCIPKETKRKIIAARLKVGAIVMGLTGMRISNLKHIQVRHLKQLLAHEGFTVVMIKKRRTELVEYAMPPKVKGPVDMVRSDIELLIKNKLDDDYVWTYTRETLTKRMNNVLKIASVVLSRNLKTQSFRIGISGVITHVFGIEKAQIMLGHSSIQTTQKYLRTKLPKRERLKIVSHVISAKTPYGEEELPKDKQLTSIASVDLPIHVIGKANHNEAAESDQADEAYDSEEADEAYDSEEADEAYVSYAVDEFEYEGENLGEDEGEYEDEAL